MITFLKLGEMGRLGNMLFQIAATIGIAKTLGHEYKFPAWEHQAYFQKPLPLLTGVHALRLIRESGFHYKPIPPVRGDISIEGYFQSPKYWAGHEDEIKPYLTLTQSAFHAVFDNWINTIKQIPPRKKLETVGIHVRRGDYVTISDYHTNLAVTKYYTLALSRIINLLGYAEIDAVVFSDDIEFCKGYFTEMKSPARFYYAPTTDPVTDLFTLSFADHHIIANSSFGWWAAYLSKNKSGHVISPGNLIPWFGPKYDPTVYNTSDLIPSHWIQI